MPTETKRDHEKFCRTEGWGQARDATGKPVGHHLTFELPLDDGRILRTRISHPVDNTRYVDRLWSPILKLQLEITPPEFWACVKNGVLPDRGQASAPAQAPRLPLYLVNQLVTLAGLTEEEAVTLTTEQAAGILADYWQNYAGGDGR